MIRNGVIDAQKEFAERRHRVDADRNFEKVKAQVLEKHGVDIEVCRATYVRSQGKLFAVVGDWLVDTFSTPPHVERWEDYKRRNQQG